MAKMLYIGTASALAGALFAFLFVMPAILFGECAMRWSSACTRAEQAAGFDWWKQRVLSN